MGLHGSGAEVSTGRVFHYRLKLRTEERGFSRQTGFAEDRERQTGLAEDRESSALFLKDLKGS